MALQDVKFKQGQYASLPTSLDTNTLYFAKDQAVMGAAGKLYYGQPTITYADEKITLWGYKGATAEAEKLGEINLSLDSFLEKAQYFGTGATMAEIATWAGHDITADAVETEYKKAFEVEEGGQLPAEHSAIVMVMHGESSEGDTHSLVVIPVGKLMGDVQGEVDKIETAVGLNQDGTYSKTTGSTTSAATSVKGAIEALDTKAVELQSELDATQTGAGLNADGTYSANTAAHTISGASSLKDADDKLDAMIGAKSTGTTVAAETVWAAIEEVAAEKTAVVEGENNLNITVSSADTSGKVTYTVGESGLTPSANGVAIKTTNTVAQNLKDLDDKINVLSASTKYDVAFSARTEEMKVKSSDTVAEAILKLDDTIAALVDEVLDNEETASNAISALAEAAGVKAEDGEIAYQVHEDDSILSSATTLDSADVALADAIRDLQASAGALEGVGAIVVTAKSATDKALQVSLKVDNSSKTDGNALITLTQTEGETGGLNAQVKLDNTAAASVAEGETKESGIGLVQGTDGAVKATLYWGSF